VCNLVAFVLAFARRLLASLGVVSFHWCNSLHFRFLRAMVNHIVFTEFRWTLHDEDLDFASVDAGELELGACRCDTLCRTALEFTFVATASIQYPPRCSLK
jgi:hypothetical protein